MQHFDPEHHHRRSIRLKGFDYSRNGAYLVTLCSERRKHLFGVVENAQVKQNVIGREIEECWKEIPSHFHNVDIDIHIIMPNHFHGILFIDKPPSEMKRGNIHQPTTEGFSIPQHGTLPTIIRSLKSACTKRVRASLGKPEIKIWQKGYWERVIRDVEELRSFRTNIANNPSQWQIDRFY